MDWKFGQYHNIDKKFIRKQLLYKKTALIMNKCKKKVHTLYSTYTYKEVEK